MRFNTANQESQTGKTAPRLLYDLSLFDPRSTLKEYNALTDPAPIFEGKGPQPVLLPRGSCRHDFLTKTTQSSLPPQDVRAGPNDVYRLGMVCRMCRTHVDVVVDYKGAGPDPCPNEKYPLHHFMYQPALSSPLAYNFLCSSTLCSATLNIKYTPQLVTPAHLALLTDPEALARRFEEAKRFSPNRAEVEQVTPFEATRRFRCYVRDALNQSGKYKGIPVIQKKFMTACGRDCDDILRLLGFQYTVSVGSQA